MIKRVLVVACLAAAVPLVGGCSWIQSSLGWSRARPDDGRTAADLDSCKAAARAVNRREARINQDIGGSSFFNDSASNNLADPTLARNMDAYAADQRYTRIVDECMSGQGYGAPAPEAQPTAKAAPPAVTTSP